MVIILIGLTVIGVICAYTYIETDRREIQRKQEALQRENEILQAKLKEQEKIRHDESLKHIGEAEV
jgi:hypothetical protein